MHMIKNKDIHNSYYLLNAYFAPGTTLNTLHTLSHLVSSTPCQESLIPFTSGKAKLRKVK